MPQNVNSSDVLIRDEELKVYIKSFFGNATIKKLTGQNVQVNVNDVVAHKSNNTITFYKVIKNGNITVPTTEYCKKIEIGLTDTFEEIKKKIFIG